VQRGTRIPTNETGGRVFPRKRKPVK